MLAAALAFLALAAAARAEVLTLLCTGAPQYGQTPVTVEVNLSNQTACIRFPGGPDCTSLGSVTVTDKAITFHPRNSGNIDRVTGAIQWADGSAGTCKPAPAKPKF
ncbi:MAG: hypothetical protein KGL11_02435 [Alphaproteobacteria bacterium]|nr:hypothetical protein [Alphaproteobacteria bacterium]